MQSGEGDGPVVMFGHACGFAAGAYLPLLEDLARTHDVFAFDARGHGGSDRNTEDLSLYTIDYFAHDLGRLAQAVQERIGARKIHYVGHSLGAVTLLRLGTFWHA